MSCLLMQLYTRIFGAKIIRIDLNVLFQLIDERLLIITLTEFFLNDYMQNNYKKNAEIE